MAIGSISGTIQDPTGAVITGARIEISGAALPQAAVLASDAAGAFTSGELKAGTYVVRVTHDGFDPLAQTVEVQGAVKLTLTLEIIREKVVVNVPGKALALANSDAIYLELRTVGTSQTYQVDNFTLALDVGTFEFTKGTVTVLASVEGVETGAVFLGQGNFKLTPALSADAHEMERRTGARQFSEDFSEVVMRFTRGGWASFAPRLGGKVPTPGEVGAALLHWRERMRVRRERPLGFTEHVLHGETMDNVDADLLAAIYNPAHPAFFNAYIHGVKHKDLRFFVRNRVGAVPQMDSPEEVALINYDPEGMDDGVWYLAHFKQEYLNGKANSAEDRRLFATRRYKIETVIAKNDRLFSVATITFSPLIAGERVLKFGLLPNLRVERVLDEDGQPLRWIQESRKEDGSFYAVLPAAPEMGKDHAITVEYAGDKVLEVAGEGSFYVGARTSWYPNLNGFGERALYDLTFKVPHRYKVVSVGDLRDESTQGDFAVTHWVTPIPVVVAGFNYGDYKKLDIVDSNTNYKISGYYMERLPDNLRRFENGPLGGMAPGAMTKYALEQTRAQMQLCTYYFGRSPYGQVNITEQPDFNFGQSWPGLVYLPISAYMDSTQRWLLFGHIDNNFTGFVLEVTPHEVAHQWWGHTVMWASYHDQWLSEGFAEFSAALFLQQAVGKDWRKDYIEFWDRLQHRILEKNNFGVAPNDAGPIWMGERLISPKTGSAYQNVVYPKGAYILSMLRSMMYDPETKDKEFIDMMHDFVESHRERQATTEAFKAIAQKHMTKFMDLTKDGRLDWFFGEWVYGTQVPKYHFKYQVAPAQGGKVNVHLTVTQSEVDEHFAMIVPLFADFGQGMVPVAHVAMAGSGAKEFDITLHGTPKKLELNAYKEILERP